MLIWASWNMYKWQDNLPVDPDSLVICKQIPSEVFSNRLPEPWSLLSSMVLKSNHRAYLLV